MLSMLAWKKQKIGLRLDIHGEISFFEMMVKGVKRMKVVSTSSLQPLHG